MNLIENMDKVEDIALLPELARQTSKDTTGSRSMALSPLSGDHFQHLMRTFGSAAGRFQESRRAHVSEYDVDSALYKEIVSKRTPSGHQMLVKDYPQKIKKAGAYLKAKMAQHEQLCSDYKKLITERDIHFAKAQEADDNAKLVFKNIKDNEESQQTKLNQKELLHIELTVGLQLSNNKGKDLSKATSKQARVYAGLDTPQDWSEHVDKISRKLNLLVNSKYLESPHCKTKQWNTYRIKTMDSIETTEQFRRRVKAFLEYVDPESKTAIGNVAKSAAEPVHQEDSHEALRAAMLASLFARVMNSKLPAKDRMRARRELRVLLDVNDEDEEDAEDQDLQRPAKRTKTSNSAMAAIPEENTSEGSDSGILKKGKETLLIGKRP